MLALSFAVAFVLLLIERFQPPSRSLDHATNIDTIDMTRVAMKILETGSDHGHTIVDKSSILQYIELLEKNEEQ